MSRLLLALFLAACFGRTTLNDPHSGELKLTVYNELGNPLCALHVFPIGETNEGRNHLSGELQSGRMHHMWLPKSDPHDTYQVHATGCSYEKRTITGYAPSVILNGPAHVVLYDESSDASKQTATELAQEHANTTLVRAKITRNANPSARPEAEAPPPMRR